jgi:uncharacterized protein (DUF1778 family)
MSEARKRLLKVYVTDADEATIKEMAQVCGRTVSTFLRSAALGTPLRSVTDVHAIEVLGSVMKQQRELMRLLDEVPDSLTKSTLMTQIRVVKKHVSEAAKRIRV